jgi:hypothetical protein
LANGVRKQRWKTGLGKALGRVFEKSVGKCCWKLCFKTALENSSVKQHWKMALENNVGKMVLENGIGKWRWKTGLENGI